MIISQFTSKLTSIFYINIKKEVLTFYIYIQEQFRCTGVFNDVRLARLYIYIYIQYTYTYIYIHIYLLHMNNEVKKMFTPKPTISFRSARKISSYLLRAKLYPEERTKGSFKCGRFV